MSNYDAGIIKKYQYWTLSVSFRQPLLGTLVIWANRETEKLTQLSQEELMELQTIMKEAEVLLAKAFFPERFNYLQLGNNNHHLHIFCLPRYENSRKFSDKTWNDKSWGHFPIWTEEEMSFDFVQMLKDFLVSVNT